MDLKYKNVKRRDVKGWLLGGNAFIYGFILLVTLAAIIVVLMATGSIKDDHSDESTASVEEVSSQPAETSDNKNNQGQYIEPSKQYKIRVNKASNFITVYSMNNDGNYDLHKQFRCSVNPSVKVQSTTIAFKYPWVVFGANTCGRFVSKLASGTYIHSVIYYNQNVYLLNKSTYNNLGNSAKTGYIYLNVADTKWIYENCGSETVVEIYEDASEKSPFAGVKLEPATTKYDPTDIEAANNYVPETKAPETQGESTSNQVETSTQKATETVVETETSVSSESQSKSETKEGTISESQSN